MTSLVPGLCSVTLRSLGIDDVARLAGECGVRSIEWGADVHVPPGDSAAAAHARRASDALGAPCPSYGSYLLASDGESADEITRVLDTAALLGAPNVRVWAGLGVNPGSKGAAAILERLREIALTAGERGLTVSVEFHGGTLTQTADSTLDLLAAVDAPNLFTSWQPPYWLPPRTPDEDAADVTRLVARLAHLHVYEWSPTGERLPLATGERRWRAVLHALDGPPTDWPNDRCALLEFVTDDSPDALRRDASTLHRWLAWAAGDAQ